MINWFFVLVAILIISSCSTSRYIKPLEKGEVNTSFDLGGPLIGFSDMTIPIPLTSLSAGYGIDSVTTGFAGFQLTSSFYGLVQADLGIVREIVKQNNYLPGISVSPIANLMYDKWEGNFRFYPQFDVNFYWNYLQSKNYFYTGFNNWFEPRTVKAHGEKQKTHWIPYYSLGHTFVREKMNYSIEAKYIAPFNSNQNIVVDYKSFGNNGATGVYFSIIKKF